MMESATAKKGRGLKVLAFFVLAMIVLGAGYYAWSWNHFYRNASERTVRDMTFMWHWKMYSEGMKEAYTNDTYGGDTPEETLRLFVEALKAGDIELASKYYIPEKQEKIHVELKDGVQSPNFLRYVNYVNEFITNPKRTHASSTDAYFISYPFGDDGVSTTMQFYKNPISKKWKIAAP